MLTRLRVTGFKNLIDFDCWFGPYNCIAGPNGVGKSNVFDAIEFLSLLSDHSFLDAAQRLRLVTGVGTNPRTLFWMGDDAGPLEMRFEAEMIVPGLVQDDFGRDARPTSTFLNYEVTLTYVQPSDRDAQRQGPIALKSESLRHITKGRAREHLPWAHSAAFRDAVVRNDRRTPFFISTEEEHGEAVVNVHQDGGSRGQPRKSPAARAPRTVVCSTTSSDDPTILAAKREMQQWRMLALEPSAMRSPDEAVGPTRVEVNGAHMAATLNRLCLERGEDVLALVAATASELSDVRELRVDQDDQRQLLTLQALVGDVGFLPARSLSDGTLRFLALSVISADDTEGGVICLEEPENGIHPGRMHTMVDLVRGLAVNPEEEPGPDNPFRQVIVNTHSPLFVQYQDPDDLLLAMPVSRNVRGSIRTVVAFVPLSGTWRAGHTTSVPPDSIPQYLTSPDDVRLSLAHEPVA